MKSKDRDMGQQNIDDIIAEILAGENITDEERMVLDRWLDQSPQNRDWLAEVVRLRVGRIEPELSFADILENISDIISRKRKRRIRNYSAAAAAAAILIVAAAGIPMLRGWDNRNDQVEHDARKITLTLSNGETIHLDNKTSVTDGNSVITSNENSLIYDVAEQEPKQVYYNTLTIPRGCEYTLKLTDGTKIHLNSDTEIRYPASHSGTTREVYLSGEAYFEVAANPERPFIVHTDGIDIRVTGTSFNVNAYPDAESVTATLEKGSVQILDGRHVLDMKPGMYARYDKATQNTELKRADTRYHTAWKDGFFYFDNLRMEEIMGVLGRWYDLTPVFVDPAVKDIRFGGRFTRYEDIEYLLGKFEETENIRFEVKGSYVEINKR